MAEVTAWGAGLAKAAAARARMLRAYCMIVDLGRSFRVCVMVRKGLIRRVEVGIIKYVQRM